MINRWRRGSRAGQRALVTLGLLALGFSMGLPSEARAASEGGSEGGVADELAQLNRSVTRLVGMMEDFLAGQEAELLMKRLEILQRRLLPTREELLRRQRNYQNAGEELEELQARFRLIEQGMEEEELAGNAPSEAERAMFKLQHQNQVERLTVRRENLWRQLEELENQVANSRADIAALEDLLDEKLGLR